MLLEQGASAVLCYGAIEAPLAQPRALIFGHFFSALIGVCIAKLFHLLPTEERYNELEWLAASLASSISIVVMQITKTTHPPAGATALLPATNTAIFAMSWYYLPIVLLSSVITLVVALLTNNIQRRYPIFWIAPPAPPAAKPAPPPPANDPEAGTKISGDTSKVSCNPTLVLSNSDANVILVRRFLSQKNFRVGLVIVAYICLFCGYHQNME